MIPADSNPLLFSSNSNKDALPLCKKLLEECCEFHPACSATRANVAAPTRLIYVGNDLIQLCDTTKLKSVPKYTALRHCWGAVPFCTLVTANLNAFHQNIPEDILLHTFKDSITTTRSLGLEYIWIDSLCIVQDDAMDWAFEAARMCDVYSGAQ